MIPTFQLGGLGMGRAAAPVGPVVGDVFHVELYTGDGAGTRSITGVDLSGGGVSWPRARSSAQTPDFYYSHNGSSPQRVGTNSTGAASAAPCTFGSGGTSLTDATNNVNTRTYVNWTLKKEAGFLDVVTYTGTGATPQNIAHSLGVVPALILVKRTDSAANWIAYNHDAGAGMSQAFQATTAFASDTTAFDNTSPTTTNFRVGNNTATNASGGSFVAILFAHNPSGFIRSFTYTGNATGLGPSVSLGWQPQWVLLLGASTRHVFDTTRTSGFTGNDAQLVTNNTTAENAGADLIQLVSDGFQAVGTGTVTNTDGRVYYGIAIRTP